MRIKTWIVTCVVAAGVAAVLPGEARASFPGADGQIALRVTTTCPTNASLSSYQVYAINPNGTGLVNRSQSVCAGYSDDYSRYSPDGSKIAFIRCCLSGVTQLFVMNSDGTAQHSLGDPVSGQRGGISWSPSGSRI